MIMVNVTHVSPIQLDSSACLLSISGIQAVFWSECYDSPRESSKVFTEKQKKGEACLIFNHLGQVNIIPWEIFHID